MAHASSRFSGRARSAMFGAVLYTVLLGAPVVGAQAPSLSTVVEQAGFCAYYKARHGLDLASVKSQFGPLPYEDPSGRFIIGDAKGQPWRLYADAAGWALVCGTGYPKRDLVSRAFHVALVDPLRMYDVLKRVALLGANDSQPNIRYYDFSYPQATLLLAMRFVETSEPSRLTIPCGVPVYEASYSCEGHFEWDGENLCAPEEGVPKEGIWSSYGALHDSQLARDTPHTIRTMWQASLSIVTEPGRPLVVQGVEQATARLLQCPVGLVKCAGAPVFLPLTQRH